MAAIMTYGAESMHQMPELSADHFLNPHARQVFQAAARVEAEGMRVDPASILYELGRNPSAARYVQSLGDAPLLSQLPTYASKLRVEHSFRQVIQSVKRIAALEKADTGTAEKLAEAQAVAQTILSGTDTAAPLVSLSEVAAKEIEFLGKVESGEALPERLETGIPDLDQKLYCEPGDLLIVAGDTSSGKSSVLGQICAWNAKERDNKSVFVTSEMTHRQMLARITASLSRQSVTDLINPRAAVNNEAGLLHGYYSGLPIWFQRHFPPRLEHMTAAIRTAVSKGATLAFIDYAQRLADMDAESQERAVGKIAEAAKNLALELEITVVMAAQVNRQIANRNDPRPRLSDLRSCLPASELVALGDGRLLSISEVKKMNGVGIRADMKTGTTGTLDVWSTGRRQVFLVRTRTGREIRCTRNHPLLTVRGWTPAQEVRPGDRIAVPRYLPEPGNPTDLPDEELRMLGYLISDGSYARHRSVGYVKADSEMIADIREISEHHFGVPAKEKNCLGDSVYLEFRMDTTGPNRNPLIQKLKEWGIHGELCYAKKIPTAVFGCSNQAVGVFLGALWSGDGTVKWAGGRPFLKFTTASRDLAYSVQYLLLRFGIIAKVSRPFRGTKSTMDLYDVTVSSEKDIGTFAAEVKLVGKKKRRIEQIRSAVIRKKGSNQQIDRLPIEVTDEVFRHTREHGISWTQLGYRCQRKCMDRDTLQRVGEKLGREDLVALAQSDILWDRIESNEHDGKEEVFDFRAPKTGNAVVSGVFAHNSGKIEQEANHVIFTYQPTRYGKDGPAELIIAKQRNGPTGVVETWFDEESCTFRPLENR